MKKLIKWKYIKRTNNWEGTIKGEDKRVFSIEGHLCVTDLRPCYKDVWESPKHYKLNGISIGEAKQLAEDLVTGVNFEKHEKNRLDWEADTARSVKVIQDAEDFLKKLQNG